MFGTGIRELVQENHRQKRDDDAKINQERGLTNELDGYNEEVSGRARIVAATVHVKVRQVLPVQAGSRPGAAGYSSDHGVLPGGVEVQMRQQAVHAVAIFLKYY